MAHRGMCVAMMLGPSSRCERCGDMCGAAGRPMLPSALFAAARVFARLRLVA